MPFTLSHPAAILPLRRLLRNRLPFAALVAGSLSPDTGYFLTPCDFFRVSAHTFSRSFTFCLPMGFLILLLFGSLRPGILFLIPNGIRTALAHLTVDNPWRVTALPFTAAALLLGSWSHILWDSFTHHNGFMVELLPALNREWVAGFPVHRILQHCSTTFGMLALFLFLAAEARDLGVRVRWRFSWRWMFWCVSLLASLLFTAITFKSSFNYTITANERREVYLFVISCVRNLGLIVVMAASFAQWKVLTSSGVESWHVWRDQSPRQ